MDGSRLELLRDPIAQDLLSSRIPARLAYCWPDGTPRVVPIWFHWTGSQIVVVSPAGAPKMRALRANPKVAVTIDSEGFPARVLLVRGTATIDEVDGVAAEYAAAASRYLGEEAGRAWVEQAGTFLKRTCRITVRPEWVEILDFETRFPSAIRAAMAS